MAHRSFTRNHRIVQSVPCPLCGAGAGEWCRNPFPHQLHRGPVDRRALPDRPHNERRAAWVAWKHEQEASNG